MKGVIYARYSSDNQTEASIEGQLRECMEFAERTGIDVIGNYIDRAFSAKSDHRPEFQRMIKDSYKHAFDCIIVWKLDRFSRNRYDSAHYKTLLRKNGVKVISAMESISEGSEGILLESVKGTPQEIMFAVALYTGLRPAEYQTATIEGDFIKARNLKRKGGKVEYKKIPISPMLKPYLSGVDKLEFSSVKTIRNQFNRTLPNHKLYDLRTSFYTRCTECGVKDVAIKKFAGHTLEGLAETYTDLSDSFLLAEGNNLCY